MKVTWTFYPRNQPSITLTVIYVPKLDARQFRLLYEPTNTAFVDWDTFKIFNGNDLKAKQDAFQRLTRIFKPNVNLGDEVLELAEG
ncbi:hypothetical protein [Runella sp.]|jgi:hypothetical protein|uniref:hypothetical protein n=1 Tax=Runella sp. TaxID=1960881 RepID=UPI00261C6DD8|nr:hypothetical protein [Runella sp.]